MFMLLNACSSDPRSNIEKTGNFGKAFDSQKTVDVAAVKAGLDTTTNFEVTVSGTITNFCKGEGCWLMLQSADGNDLVIEVKDKAFVLPYEIGGKTAIAHGVAAYHAEDSTSSVIADGIRIQ